MSSCKFGHISLRQRQNCFTIKKTSNTYSSTCSVKNQRTIDPYYYRQATPGDTVSMRVPCTLFTCLGALHILYTTDVQRNSETAREQL